MITGWADTGFVPPAGPVGPLAPVLPLGPDGPGGPGVQRELIFKILLYLMHSAHLIH